MSKLAGAKTPGTEAAERVGDVVLVFLSEREQIGVSEIARELSLSKAVVYRILRSLVSRGIVEADPISRKYSLGPTATAIGIRALRRQDIRAVARDLLVKLRDSSGETATLSSLTGNRRTYIDQCESQQEIKMTVQLGQIYPLHAGASSRAILAHVSEAEKHHVYETANLYLSDGSVVNREELDLELGEIRGRGYAMSRGQRQAGAGSVAAPVFGTDLSICGAMSVCGPISRFDESFGERIAPLVVSAANTLSNRLRASLSAP